MQGIERARAGRSQEREGAREREKGRDGRRKTECLCVCRDSCDVPFLSHLRLQKREGAREREKARDRWRLRLRLVCSDGG
jgi:hypothetical protein